VWHIEIPQFLAWKLKHHPGSELGALEAKFGSGLVGCEIWFYPISKKSTSIRVRMQKLWLFYRSTFGSRFRNAEYDSKLKSGKTETLLFVMAKVDPMDGKAQIGCHNESRLSEARVHARPLAKANRLKWWIGLLFGKVESVSGTNKAWNKILKLRTRI
jgi:hypothetical protein